MKPYRIQKCPVMSRSQRWTYRILFTIGITFTSAFFLWWFQPSHIATNFKGIFHGLDILLFLLLSYVVWYQIINECFSWFTAGFMRHPQYRAPQKGLRVAFLTAFVPGTEPYSLLEKTLKAMVGVDYAHDTWLLDEGDDPEAKRLCALYKVKHFSRKGIEKYNTPYGPYRIKTKGGNYNAWFDQYGKKYDIVAQLDVDFVPKRDYLTKTLGYFKDPSVAFVGTPQIYGNTKDSWIARGAAQQAYGFYGSMQKGLFGMDMPLFIGANHVLRVSAHDDIEGYSGHIVEDHLTGMKFYANNWKSVYVPQILAIGEGPSTWSAYFSQQMRWAYGLIDILFRHSFRIFPSMRRTHRLNYFLLQQYYFYGIAQVVGCFLLCLYFFFGLQVTPMPLATLLVFYVPILLFQQVFFLWLQHFNVDPKHERGLMISAKVLNWAAWPIYFYAFIGVIIGKRLQYVVTPKGEHQENQPIPSLFTLHFWLGSVTLMCLVAAFVFHRFAPFLVFWATLNTIIMFFFFGSESFKKLRNSARAFFTTSDQKQIAKA
ncbi:glycosyl transferase family 2 [Candidatus Cerribacteria bacterium 'Amazon FNV 2010 28 9']|uniref:Glycosyl transferase family 2 n=1 Tax=Candidatus Cerribacteria bacterium 'Amazon FNV 2010 28 9' TaxID=2081795 RepID=A0A317JQA9_9BACT|nr:MAG: glycosyl transferase family 2 [Candidatus Cerribacteria bacterium 'Amazon FNV 2010 28 9']